MRYKPEKPRARSTFPTSSKTGLEKEEGLLLRTSRISLVSLEGEKSALG